MDATPRPASGTGSRLTRILLPIAIVAVMLVAMVAIAFYGYNANRRDAGVLSDELLSVLETRIASEVTGYLAPAERMLRLAKDLALKGALTSEASRNAEAVGLNIVRANPQLAIFSFADPTGNFLMLKRMPDGTIHTKQTFRGDEVRVRWDRRDELGLVVATENTGDDGFDPRTRPWYVGATASHGLFWTDVYGFFTDQKLGITAALPVYEPRGRLRAVMAADIELDTLSEFLAGLDVSANGKVLIIDDEGGLVAYPDLNEMIAQEEETRRPKTVFELNEPVLEGAFNRFRVERHGRRDFSVDGERFVSIASSLEPAVGRNWTVLIVAPESDFLGFVARNNRTQLFLSGGVLGLAALLAVLMALQGLSADRNANAALERQRQLTAQSNAYSELAAKATLFDDGDTDALLDITEIIVQALGVRRISVWRLGADGRALHCVDCYDLEGAGHTQGSVIACAAIAPLWAALAKGEDVVTANAARDQRTSELYQLYLEPQGCTAFTAVAARHAGRTLGAVWLEDDAPGKVVDEQAVTFARTMTNMLALRLVSDERDEVDGTYVGSATAAPVQSPAQPASVKPFRAAGARMRALDLCTERGQRLEAQL
ncbi:MAG: cache domain-containing protein, partial [Gammaproteobacteria bacterium]